MEKLLNIIKRVVGTLALPVIVYIVMYILTHANGKDYFGTLEMWPTLILKIGVSVTCAMGIGLQFKSGRFDFSGGSIMLLSGIISTNVAQKFGNNVILFFIVTVACTVILSVLVSLLYVYGRLLVVITTIGMALLFESITPLIYNGSGINIVGNTQLKLFITYPAILIPVFICILVYWAFSYITVTGKQTQLLARNQTAAVNIGINERRNVIISYIYSGIIFGCATVIFSGTALQRASYSSLTTVGSLFSNILPVFIGLMLIGFCGDTIGTIIGSITLSILSYGLRAVFQEEMGSAITLIVTGVFIFAINVISAKGSALTLYLKNLFKSSKSIA